jgi:S1-C subfamily serine protease
MNLLDAIVLLLLVLSVVAGARAGFLGPVLGLVGAVAGFFVALLLSSAVREPLAQVEQPMRALVTLCGLGAFVLVGEATGAAIGTRMSIGLRGSPLRPVDALGGALVGAAHVVLLVWLVGGMLAAGMAPTLGAVARDSVAVRVATDRLPPPLSVAGGLLTLLDTTDLPSLFAGLEPPAAAPVALPADAEARALAQSALASTTRITGSGCGNALSVGSGFFVGAEHAVTNAHVVAGMSGVTATVRGGSMQAQVVAIDPEADLALLHVPGAAAAPLALAPVAPGRGSTGVALGYPGGGELTVTAAGVTAVHDIAGPDIYGGGTHGRTVVELRGTVRRGNSGGPLVVEPGVVGGIVFGASRVDPEVGYAIGSDEAIDRLVPFVGATAPVDTGACL